MYALHITHWPGYSDINLACYYGSCAYKSSSCAARQNQAYHQKAGDNQENNLFQTSTSFLVPVVVPILSGLTFGARMNRSNPVASSNLNLYALFR
jgi:hypothetical protein